MECVDKIWTNTSIIADACYVKELMLIKYFV